MLGEHPCWSYCTTTGCHGWPPTPEASEDKDNDGDTDAEDDGANSSSADEMST